MRSSPNRVPTFGSEPIIISAMTTHLSSKWRRTKSFSRSPCVLTSPAPTTAIPAQVKTMWYRFSRREDDYRIECSQDGEHFSQMRVCHMWEGAGRRKMSCFPGRSRIRPRHGHGNAIIYSAVAKTAMHSLPGSAISVLPLACSTRVSRVIFHASISSTRYFLSSGRTSVSRAQQR